MNATEVLFAVVVLEVLKDGLLARGLIRLLFAQHGATPAAPGAGPGSVTTQPPPVVAVKPRFTGITATSFGGAGDANASAYGGMVNPDAPGVALPYRFTGTRPRVRVFYNGKTCDCDIVDVGPWNINDPYWTTNSRPEAESGTDNSGRHTNLAGIDLTPAAWSSLGAAGAGKAKVDWDFVNVLDAGTPTKTPPAVTTGDPPWLAKARTYLGKTWSNDDPPSWMIDLIDGIKNNAANKDTPGFAAYCDQLKHGYRAWCGIFVAGCLAAAGKPVPFAQGNDLLSFAWAPAFDSYGTAAVPLQPGDILRFGWHGGGEHVTFYEGVYPNDDLYHILGGNQGHAVNIKTEPMDDELKFARRPPA